MTRDARTDAEIIEAILNGDRDSFGLLVQRYQRSIMAAMWRVTGDRAEAEELTQAVFCRTYFALDSYDPRYQFSTWIHRIAHNLCINTRTRGGRELALEDLGSAEDDGGLKPVDRSPSPGAQLEQQELAATIKEAILSLPDEFRDVVIMRHIQECSYREICDALDLPMGTVKSRIARGRKLLAATLDSMLR